jgi:hypothetical protein
MDLAAQAQPRPQQTGCRQNCYFGETFEKIPWPANNNFASGRIAALALVAGGIDGKGQAGRAFSGPIR